MKVTIAIPAYKQQKTIMEALTSCLKQDYRNKEILVIDDYSPDNTFDIVENFSMEYEGRLRLLRNERNLGIGGNLTRCMQEAQGEYIIYLCGDDMFAHKSVISDMVEIFEYWPRIGVMGRSYYQFMNGYPGAIGVVREKDILISSVNPSGIGFRRVAMSGEFSDGIFIEMPSMVKQVLDCGWKSYQMGYDTIAVRIKPGQNTCTVSSYYKESPTESFAKVVPGYVFYGTLITLKNRAPHRLLREMNVISWAKPNCIWSLKFWAYALVALLVPGCMLRPFTNFYKHRISRRFCEIKERGN